MAISKACSTKTSIGNTGKECDTSMVATAMLIAIARSVTFTDVDLENPTDWLTTLIHERKAFPLFGQQAPIRTINNAAESDVLVTLDDGLQVFLRYGVYNRTFETTSGGFCYAKSLQSLNKSGYGLLEIDQSGQLLARKNIDGTYSGFIVDFMYAPSPILADFRTTPYKNRFQISYSPIEIVNNGVIFEGASELLSLMGLIETEITKENPGTTTKLTIGVRTECAETDLIALFGSALADPDNFVVTNKLTGAVIPISSAAIVNGDIELTGSFASGATYTVKGAAPAVWFAADIDGYDASSNNGVDILIP